jgi:sphingomyelin phosphodiesterase 2
LHPVFTENINTLSDEAQIDIVGVTCESKLNTYRPKDLETATDDPNAKRLDYIFTSETQVDSVDVVFVDRIPVHNINYSDHFGVSATVYLPEEHRIPNGYIPPAIFDSIHTVTTKYMFRERRHNILRIYHYFLSLMICMGMFVFIFFARHRVGMFTIMFISTTSSWCGLLSGLIGYVWGRWERRYLREFASEMDLARKIYLERRIPVVEGEGS